MATDVDLARITPFQRPAATRAGEVVREPERLEAAAPGVDQPRIARAVRELLLALGEDPDREGLVETPDRVARAYADLCGGLFEDPGVHLSKVFDEGCGETVTLRGIPFHSLCEHHLLPFSGVAHVAYLPRGGRVVGLSKLARTVETFARRPQVQERMTAQIADAIAQHLDAAGVCVIVEAEHSCMKMRGVEKSGAVMSTTAHRGVLRDDPALRREVMDLLLRRD